MESIFYLGYKNDAITENTVYILKFKVTDQADSTTTISISIIIVISNINIIDILSTCRRSIDNNSYKSTHRYGRSSFFFPSFYVGKIGRESKLYAKNMTTENKNKKYPILQKFNSLSLC